MGCRRLASVALLLGALVLGAPALADPSSQPGTATRDDHRPQHTSDDEPGGVALPVPEALRLGSTVTDRVTWQVSPGVTYTRWDQTDARGPMRLHLLTVDPATPGVRLDYAAKGAVRSTARTSEILAVDKAVAGVNGDFYDIDDTGAPLGLGVDRQQRLLHGRRSGWSSAFYLTGTGRPRIGTLSLVASLVQRPGISVTNLNSPFVAPDGVGIYTRAWGRTAGYRVTDGQRRGVRAVEVRSGRVRAVRTRLSTNRAIRGQLLIGRGAGAQALGRLRVGNRLTVTARVDRRVQMAITGSTFLLTDGVVQVDDDTALHPRTAVGIDPDTGQVLLLVVDGRT